MEDQKSTRAEKILAFINDSRLHTGAHRLIFYSGKQRKIIDFQNGMISYLDSTEMKEKFSVMLVLLNILTTNEIKCASAERNLKSPELDEFFIREKKLTDLQVRKVFSMQLSKIVMSLLEWEELQSMYTEREPAAEPSMKPLLHLEEMKLHLFRFIELPTDRIKKQQEAGPIGLVVDKLPIMKVMPFNSQESIVLSKLTGLFGVDEVVKQINIPQEKVLQYLAIFDSLDFLTFGCAPKPVRPTPVVVTAEASRNNLANVSAQPATPPKPPSADSTGILEKKPEVDLEDVSAKIAEYTALLAEFEQGNYYALFELSQDNCSVSELKTRYYALIKQYHPDMFERFNSKELSDILQRISNLINTAYETLKDPALRTQYDESLHVQKPSRAQEMVINIEAVAAENFNRGKSMINNQKYGEAISSLRRAVQLRPENSEYNAYLGYAMSKTPQFRREAETYFLKSVQINPMNVSTYLHMGRMYREAGLLAKAASAFQKALDWDPENRLALKELQEMDSRAKEKNAGFFSKLFKK